jgi:hypothetical protein
VATNLDRPEKTSSSSCRKMNQRRLQESNLLRSPRKINCFLYQVNTIRSSKVKSILYTSLRDVQFCSLRTVFFNFLGIEELHHPIIPSNNNATYHVHMQLFCVQLSHHVLMQLPPCHQRLRPPSCHNQVYNIIYYYYY